MRYLPLPDGRARLDKLTEMGRDDDEELHPFFRALTRLTEPTVTVVCLFGSLDDVFLDHACTRPLSLTQTPNMAGAAAILRRSCSIGDRRVVECVEATPVPAAWKKAALLRNCRPLFFDANGCFAVGQSRLRLSSDIGLTVEENPEC